MAKQTTKGNQQEPEKITPGGVIFLVFIVCWVLSLRVVQIFIGTFIIGLAGVYFTKKDFQLALKQSLVGALSCSLVFLLGSGIYSSLVKDDELPSKTTPTISSSSQDKESDTEVVVPESVTVTPDPEPVVVAPDPEPVVVAPDPEPVVVTPEPEPVVVTPEPVVTTPQKTTEYVGSTDSDKYHYEGCRWAENILASNKLIFTSIENAQSRGYSACGTCKPR